MSGIWVGMRILGDLLLHLYLRNEIISLIETGVTYRIVIS